MKKLLFVMNPYAGMRKANRYLTDIITIFNRADYDVTAYMTSGSGDAQRMVTERAAEMDLVVCAGGDGTFNETVNGILRSGADTPIGYIPCGSTNEFASSLKLPANILKAAQLIVDGVPNRYDVGKFGDRYFSYVASFGAFTKASYSTPQNVKNALGHTAYVLEGIQELSQLKTTHDRFELDDRVIEDDFLFGMVTNSTSVGGFKGITGKFVDLSDGVFEVTLIKRPRSLEDLNQIISALTMKDIDAAQMYCFKTSYLRFECEEAVAWTLDGEREDGHEKVSVENLHHAIALITKG